MDAVSAYGGIISRVEAATIHAQWMRDARRRTTASHISGRMYRRLRHPGGLLRRGAEPGAGRCCSAFADEVFAKVDVLATPTIRTCLPTLAETDIDHGPPGTEHKFLAVSANTRPFNYLGLPAVSVPCGFDPNGCRSACRSPGRPFAEARVLQVADAYQRDTDWHTRRPPVLDARRTRRASSWHEQTEGRVHRHRRHDRLARRGSAGSAGLRRHRRR